MAPGGWLVCSGSNDTGAGSIIRELKAALGDVGGLSKHHCKVFWARRQDGPMPAQLAAWAEAGRQQEVAGIGAVSQPGLYGWNKVDHGSELLAAHFSADIKGRVADLGAGWGYLGLRLLAACPGVKTLDLIEAEGLAVEAAEVNLSRAATAAQVRVLWQDVAAGLVPGSYDWVVMNPPFHVGKTQNMDLGRGFIAAAAQGLAANGKMMLVANRHLPYEAEIAAHFTRQRVLAETTGFKMIEAQR